MGTDQAGSVIARNGAKPAEPPAPQRCPIVGIGASAGGVEALSALFRAVPADSGLAYVVVVHLGAGRESLLPEILARHAVIPVVTPRDGEPLRPDHVYVLSADAALTVAAGRLRVAPRAAGRTERNPIDILFAALAEDAGDRAAGVVLSGAGSDGTLGLKAIRERGGLTIAQGTDGSTPSHPSMPDTAIAAGAVDLVLPVEDIPRRLVEFARGLRMLDGLAAANEHASLSAELRSLRGEICTLLLNQVGHDFSGYKEPTLFRRIHRRMRVLDIGSAQDYVARLRRDPDEVTQLFRDLLIGVTAFFRDVDAFEALRREIVPRIFEGRGADDQVRVWIPGCATGEETYSIAIMLREHMDTLRAVPRVQIFATDINDSALTVARAGRYPVAMLEGRVPPERLRQFFIDEGETCVVAKAVRDLCVFSAHSVIRDPPFSRMDLVSCRNLLIYLGPEVQRRVIPLFHYALRPGGYLFLGTSESTGQLAELFAPVEKKHRIYRRRDTASPPEVPIWVPPGVRRNAAGPGSGGGARPSRSHVLPGGMAERRVLDAFAPAHVVVNRDGEAVHFSARTGVYLEPAQGAPNRQILAMARKGLRLDLRAALREAMQTRRPAHRGDVPVDLDQGRVQHVAITVEPLDGEEADPLFLVIFADQGEPLAAAEAAERRAAAAAVAAAHDGGAAAEQERELRETRDRLQATIEEYETAIEELKSANEELVSYNEEVQSSNEELETAKEELQSVNEELHTVNSELSDKFEELGRVNTDLRNLFDSTPIATVFLDRELRIRSFTKPAAEIFNLIPGDRGRRLTDLTNRLDYPGLKGDIEAVLAGGQPSERRMGGREGRAHYLARLIPYRTEAGEVDGVVASFVDISAAVAEAHQRMLVGELNHRVKNTLTVVIGIAMATLAEGAERESFMRRLRALARAHDVLAREGWGDVSLLELLQGELAPYGVDGKQRFSLSGPDLAVSPRISLSLALVLHELATNAAKYGALSVPEGKVEVAWSRLDDARGGARLRLDWHEAGGPPVTATGRKGFGSRVIEREIRHGLGGTVAPDYQHDGLRVVLEIPLATDPAAAAAAAAWG